ncbi:MAG: hypothetical protein IKU65_04975 [Oscillospiraceae bacterium]|nr:hypothetical protein [Oscillospiraceae bacterium]
MKLAVCIFTAIALSVVPIFAVEEDVAQAQYEAFGIDELVRASPATDVEFDEGISLNEGLGKIWDKMRSSAGEIFTGGLRCVMTLVLVSFLTSSIGALFSEYGSAVKSATALSGALACTASAFGSITSVISLGREFISRTDVFLKSLIPTLAAAEASCAGAGAAVAKAGATLLFSNVLISIINYVFMPLVYVNIFLAAANAATENGTLQRISGLLSKVISGTLKILLGAYVSYITVSGISASGVDKLGLRAAQLAAGTVPVVGGMISNVSETVIAGALLMKNAIGVFGMLTVLSVFATPFLTMAINYIMFKFAACVASPLIGGKISELSDRFAESFGQVLAMCTSVALLVFISIVASMKGVGVI